MWGGRKIDDKAPYSLSYSFYSSYYSFYSSTRCDQKVPGQVRLNRKNSNYSKIFSVPSKYFPSAFTKRNQRSVHPEKQFLQSFSEMLLKTSVAFSLMSSIVSKRRLFKALFNCGKRKKSARAKSGKQGGYGTTGMRCLARNCWILKAL